MSIHELCCVGHITSGKVITPRNAIHMPGGASLYFLHAIKHFGNIDYTLVIVPVESEMKMVEELRAESIDVTVMPNKYTAYFENIYGENQDNHIQRVLVKVNPFTVEYLKNINFKIFHLGSLLADDLSSKVVKYLAEKGLVSIDSQGYLREVRDENVLTVNWPERKEVFKYVHLLKASERETEVLAEYTDIVNTGKVIYDWGVKEVLLAFGNMGSIIYDGSTFHKVPVYIPKEVVNAAGVGDTYMTGYPYKRAKGTNIEEAGCLAAAMTTLRVEGIGPFNDTKEDVL